MMTLVGRKMISRTAGGFGVALGCPEMLAASAKEFEVWPDTAAITPTCAPPRKLG